MKIANVNGRAALVLGDEIADIATASDGRFGPDPMGLYDDWDAFASFADRATSPAPGRSSRPTSATPCPRRARSSPSASTTASHAEESGMAVPAVPATFTKFPASLAGPFDDVEIVGRAVDWEVELVAVDRPPRRPRRGGRRLVARRRGHRRAGHQRPPPPVRRRRPVLPRQVPPRLRPDRAVGRHADELADPDDLALGCSVDGETMQDARTSDLIFDVPQLIAELSAVLPLLPGDVIFTGTPAGVGVTRQPPRFLQPGHVLESWIEGIGTIRNVCR